MNGACYASGQFCPSRAHLPVNTSFNGYQFTHEQNYNHVYIQNGPDPEMRSGIGWLLEKNGEPVPVRTLDSVYTQRAQLRPMNSLPPKGGPSQEPFLRRYVIEKDPFVYERFYRPQGQREEAGYPVFLRGM